MDKPCVVVLLQNAWSTLYTWLECGLQPPDDHDWVWDRKGWLGAFERSRSGRRWSLTVDEDERWGSGVDATICNIPTWFDNTTPMIANRSSGVHRPDFDYMRRLLGGELLLKNKPGVVVACGKQAAVAVLKVWDGSLVTMPHPACRVLTNDAMIVARSVIRDAVQNFADNPNRVVRRQIVQQRGRVEYHPLEA